MTTVQNTPELSGLARPSLVEVMPSMFVNSDVLEEARRLAAQPQGQSVSTFSLLFKRTIYCFALGKVRI